MTPADSSHGMRPGETTEPEVGSPGGNSGDVSYIESMDDDQVFLQFLYVNNNKTNQILN